MILSINEKLIQPDTIALPDVWIYIILKPATYALEELNLLCRLHN